VAEAVRRVLPRLLYILSRILLSERMQWTVKRREKAAFRRYEKGENKRFDGGKGREGELTVEGGGDDRLLLSFASLVDDCERKNPMSLDLTRRKKSRKRTASRISVDACEPAGRRLSSQNVAENHEKEATYTGRNQEVSDDRGRRRSC
jgi:hypothetical protein